MTFDAGEPGGKEGPYYVTGKFLADDTGTEADHVHIVVLYALVRRERIVAETCTNARELVDRH
jgi:hypothetical protein